MLKPGEFELSLSLWLMKNDKVKGKGKARPTTGHEGIEE
jgi:hypothetical protein